MRVTSSGSSSSRVARITMKRVREWEKRRSNAAMDVLVNSLLVFSFLFHAFIKIHGVILLSSLGLGIRTWERPASACSPLLWHRGTFDAPRRNGERECRCLLR